MICPQLQHATEKIADGAANCLYAAGLHSAGNVMLTITDKTIFIDWLITQLTKLINICLHI